jgi:hypothetical protein
MVTIDDRSLDTASRTFESGGFCVEPHGVVVRLLFRLLLAPAAAAAAAAATGGEEEQRGADRGEDGLL